MGGVLVRKGVGWQHALLANPVPVLAYPGIGATRLPFEDFAMPLDALPATLRKAPRSRPAPNSWGLPAPPAGKHRAAAGRHFRLGRRRTPGLRREEVAQLAGVGVTWYTWLEQGRAVRASEQVIGAIARALLATRRKPTTCSTSLVSRADSARRAVCEKPSAATPGHPRCPRPVAGPWCRTPVSTSAATTAPIAGWWASTWRRSPRKTATASTWR